MTTAQIEYALGIMLRTSEELATQDNASTQDPIFLVQQQAEFVRQPPGDGDEIRWVTPDGEGPCTMAEATEEMGIDAYPWNVRSVLIQRGATEIGIESRWEHVSAHFTRAAATRYIEANKHRMTEPRIYVDTQYRCNEWNMVRAVLLAAHRKPGALEEFVRAALS